MVDEDTKFCPVTVNVKAAAPAFAKVGLRERIPGTGFDGGGDWFPPKLPELPEPPQPAPNKRETRNVTVMTCHFPTSQAFLDALRGIKSKMALLINPPTDRKGTSQ